jgi:hypothetical protein
MVEAEISAIVSPRHHLQSAGSRGSSQIHGEAVGNDYLDCQHRLPPEKIDEPRNSGSIQDEPPNFVREFAVATEEHAREIARLASTF